MPETQFLYRLYYTDILDGLLLSFRLVVIYFLELIISVEKRLQDHGQHKTYKLHTITLVIRL